jgi:hypothetical protein
MLTEFWLDSLQGGRPLGRPKRRWEDGIKMDLRDLGLEGAVLDLSGSGY